MTKARLTLYRFGRCLYSILIHWPSETAPIVAVHIWYDRPALREKYVAVLESPLQWVFNDTDLKSRDDGGGQHIVISLSGAWEWKDRSKQELRAIFTAEMERVFPAARDAAIRKFTVVKMLDATFRVGPGSQKSRLSQRTPLPGFYLAGDWTDTGWPSTMESAVRSGNLAAGYIADDIGTGARGLENREITEKRSGDR